MGTTGKGILNIGENGDFRARTANAFPASGCLFISPAHITNGLEKIEFLLPDLINLDAIMESDFAGHEANRTIKFRDRYTAEDDVPLAPVSSVQMDPAPCIIPDSKLVTFAPDACLSSKLDMPVFFERVSCPLAVPHKRTPVRV